MKPLYSKVVQPEMIGEVVGKKVHGNKTYYKIQFAGSLANLQTPAWVMRENLIPAKEIINDYNKRTREERKLKEPHDEKSVEVLVDINSPYTKRNRASPSKQKSALHDGRTASQPRTRRCSGLDTCSRPRAFTSLRPPRRASSTRTSRARRRST